MCVWDVQGQGFCPYSTLAALRRNWKIINNEKRPAVNRAEMRQDMNEDILTHGETMSEEQLLEGLRKTPELKRRLVMRVAADLLESEAFLEAYRIWKPRNK